MRDIRLPQGMLRTRPLHFNARKVRLLRSPRSLVLRLVESLYCGLYGSGVFQRPGDSYPQVDIYALMNLDEMRV